MAVNKLEVLINYIANTAGIKSAVTSHTLLKASLKDLNIKVDENTKITDQNVKLYEKKGKTYAKVVSEFRRGNGPLEEVSKNFKIVARSAKEAGQVIPGTGFKLVAMADNASYTAKTVDGLGGALNKLSGNFKEAFSRAILVVPAWQTARTVIGGLSFAFTQTVKVMKDLDEGVRRTIVVFDKFERTALIAEKLKKAFTDLSISSGLSIENISKSSRELARAGLNAEETIKATEAAVKLMTVTEVEQGTAVRALVLANNLYGQSLKEAAKGQNTFNVAAAFFSDVSDRTLGSLDDLFQGFVVFAPTAKQLGLELEEITGLLAAMDRIGFGGTTGGTILNRLFSVNADDVSKVNEIIKNFGGTVDRTATPMQRFITLFKTLIKAVEQQPNLRETIFAQLTDFFGFKGVKGVSLIDELPNFLKDLERMQNILGNSADSVDRLNDKFKTVTEQQKLLEESIKTGIGVIGEEFSALLIGAESYNTALLHIKNSVFGIRDAIKEVNSNLQNSPIFDFLTKGFVNPFQSVNEFTINKTKSIIAEKFKPKEQKQQEATASFIQEKAASFSPGDFPPIVEQAKEAVKISFIFNKESKERLNLLREEYKQLILNNKVVDKTAIAVLRYKASVQVLINKIKELTGKDLTSKQIALFSTGSSRQIGQLLKDLGLDEDTKRNVTPAIEDVKQTFNIKKQEQDKDHFDEVRREKEKQELQLDNLKTLGYSEEEISALKLKLYENEADFKEKQHKLDLQRIDAYQKRIQEVTDSLKSSFQSNFESLFKNEITPSKFLGNIGGTFQDLSIKSTASKATEAVLGTGLARQFAEGLEATEQNPIVRSFIEGARRAGPYLSSAIANGATGQVALNTPGIAGGGGIGGLLGGIFGGNKKDAAGKDIPGSNVAGGFINAGITGVLTGISSAQRGGKTAGILGGAGGFLTSAAPFLGALRPIGGLVGAGLTIASFFSKKKSVESRTEEQLISIAPKIDVSNRKLELINRNLVALKNVMEQYVLPQSAYYSATTNIADNFSINARRGLV